MLAGPRGRPEKARPSTYRRDKTAHSTESEYILDSSPGEEVEASLHGRIACPFLECNPYDGSALITSASESGRLQSESACRSALKEVAAGPAIRAKTEEQRKNLTSKGRRAMDKPNKRFKDLARESCTHKE